MERTAVSSSDLKSVGYDQTSGTLEVEFHRGGTYQYSAVPPTVYDALLAAPSLGSFFAQHIRWTYQYRRLS